MIQYQVRSVQLLNLINDLISEKLVSDPFYQRNLVWRDLHKQDFIQTILLGFPFPQIFISKGKIDLEKRISIASIVDGQQRCNAILGYVNNQFQVNNHFFDDLSPDEKAVFFKYEVAVIELDLDHKDPKIKEIFQRINRTSSSLTGIEKKSSEYSASVYMLFAQYLSNHLSINQRDLDSLLDSSDESDDIRLNPYLTDDLITWFKSNKIKYFNKLLNSENIFTKLEISRKVNLMYTLNLVTTYLKGLYHRNNEVWKSADLYTEEFDEKEIILNKFEIIAKRILDFKFPKSSMWYGKANFFSLFYEISKFEDAELNWEELQLRLNSFEPSDQYQVATQEGVNYLKEREIRSREINCIISQCLV